MGGKQTSQKSLTSSIAGVAAAARMPASRANVAMAEGGESE